MTLRVIYNYILVSLGLRKILPAEIINRKAVRESGEPLDTTQKRTIVFADVASRYARKGMITRLGRAADLVFVTHGLKLLIYELYRSPKKQAELRKRDKEEIIRAHPEFNEEQIMSALNRISAGVGSSGHQTGAAVDLSLCDEHGNPLDMGTRYLEHNEKTVTECRSITKEQRNNRKILLDAMHEVGFVNYPGEWWHFCYGDKMWAAYKHRRYAIYGELNEYDVQLDIVAIYSPDSEDGRRKKSIN